LGPDPRMKTLLAADRVTTPTRATKLALAVAVTPGLHSGMSMWDRNKAQLIRSKNKLLDLAAQGGTAGYKAIVAHWVKVKPRKLPMGRARPGCRNLW